MQKIREGVFEISKEGAMRAPARIYASEGIIEKTEEGAIEQLKNSATLPGIQKYAIALPDIHFGYGFCIGGVAAFDAKEGGVVSPGGVGYDINCLPAETKILHKFGYHKTIAEFEKTWQKDSIKIFDAESGTDNSEISLFLKKEEKEKLIKITTKAGLEILATREHPFFTKNGMIEAQNLDKKEIAVFPFQGVAFEGPSEKLIVDEQQIREKYPGNQNGFNQIIAILKKNDLLPLKENNPKLPILAKISGFIQGDGTLHFLKKGGAIAGFYGKKQDLLEIKKDLKTLGFASVLYSRNRHHKITTTYDTIEFFSEETSLHSSSRALISLLAVLGCTLGNKTKKDVSVPEWILNSPKWIKRLYIAAFFGAELTSPKIMPENKFNFFSPVLSLNKKQEMIENCRQFMRSIKEILKEFGVKSELIAERKEFVNEKGEISIRLRLQVSSTPENLEKLWSTIGFEYNKKKTFLANTAVLYLKLKQKVLAEREQSVSFAKELKKQGKNLEEITATINSPFVNQRFVERSLYEGRKTKARIAGCFEGFSEFLEKRTMALGETGFAWDEIEKTEEIPFNGTVYDFTINNANHNFVANSFLVSNCGVRLIRTNLKAEEIKPHLKKLIDVLFELIPAGVGEKGKIRLSTDELGELFSKGAEYSVEKGYGWKKDLEKTEEKGHMKNANIEKVSQKAFQRGLNQSGTLGSGNHFLEIQEVKQVFDSAIAKKFGLFEGQAVIMLHSGSRGAGHQIATDYIETMLRAMEKYKIEVPDRQLACAPINSEEGQSYLQAMNAGVNYAFANRQAMTHWIREGFEKVLGQKAEDLGMEIVYDVCHNIAKLEKHEIEGKQKELLVHRKGATRAMPAGRKENPEVYITTGHPAIIPGSMGTSSYVLVGTETALKETFASVCHGAGRAMSRHAAMQRKRGEQVKKELEAKGQVVKGASWAGLAEEMPEAYKDIDEVIASVELSGIGKKISRHSPMAVMKG